MIHSYQGYFLYDYSTISNWNNHQIGVYYCGFVAQNGKLTPLYIGKATGEEGIRGRLLQHLNEDNWPEVTSFGYCVCDTAPEADSFEMSEISRCQPKYNIQGK